MKEYRMTRWLFALTLTVGCLLGAMTAADHKFIVAQHS